MEIKTKKRNWRSLTNTDNPILIAIWGILVVVASFTATLSILYLTKMEDIVNYLDSAYEEIKELETQAIDVISLEAEKINYNGTAYVTPLYKSTTASGYRYTLRYRNKPYGTYEIQICIITTKEGKIVDMWPDVESKASLSQAATSILINKTGIISAWIDLLICIIVSIKKDKKELISTKTDTEVQI